MNNLVTTKQLMEILQISNSTIWRFRKKGMPFINMGYNMCRYNLKDVESWMNNGGKDN